MRRTVISFMVVAMLAMSSVAAFAHDTPEYTALEEALNEAQAEVDRLEAEVERLEGEIEEAEADVAVQQAVVDKLEGELSTAEAALEVASDRLEWLTAFRAACDANNETNQLRNACRNPTNPEFNALTASVPALQAEVELIEGDLAVQQEELERLEAIVTELVEDKELTEKELADAIVVRDAAKAALDAYVPPSADVHPGCKGINNAQEQISKNGAKGKAPAALAAVADKLGC